MKESASQSNWLSVIDRQKSAVLSMLSACTTTADPFEDTEDVWKVLVYDAVGRDIIAPLLSVADLRSAGVTLHLLLGTIRHPIPDVPAVYFVEPTRENVARIVSDANRGLYASLWINFTQSIPRENLEVLAEGVAAATRPDPLAGRIARIYDMYASFHALEDNLFSLNLPGVYAKLNATRVSNAEVESLVATIVDRLFCAVVTLGAVPVIRAQKGGGPAMLVATTLEARIREHLKASNNVFHDSGGFTAAPSERPLLVIVDRALDIPVMLHHTWTYQALAHDVLSLKLNRISLPVKDADTSSSARRTYDLDRSDEFWREHSLMPFPMVAEAVEAALQAYQTEVVDINRSTGSMGQTPVEALNGDINDGAAANKLKAVVSNIPELAKKKRMIDLHTNIATALLDEIKSRGLDGFFQVEEELLSRPSSFDVERIVALLRDARGSVTDKMRLFLIYYLCVDAASEEELERCVAELRAAGCSDLRAYKYLKGIRAFTRSMSATSAAPLSTSSSIGGVYAASVLDTLSQVANNVNKLILSADKALAAARDVQALMEAKAEGDVNERYAILDPKAPKNSLSTQIARASKDAILFVVGPGNYIEFQNCQDHVCSKVVQEGKRQRMEPNGKTVVYGATELCTGVEFIEQLRANGEPDEPVPLT